MKRELLSLKKLTIEGIHNHDRLYDIDLILRESECLCLTGAAHEKDVLSEYLSGKGRRISGSIRVLGRDLILDDRRSFEKNKIFVIDRAAPYMNTLTIGENIFVLRRNSLKKFLIRESAVSSQTEYYFNKYKLLLHHDTPSGSLTTADKLTIGIIRCISQGAGLILLYNVSAAFSQKEFSYLLSLIVAMKKEGIGILISDNNPDAFFSVSDRLIVFKHRRIAKKIYRQEDFYMASRILLGEVPLFSDKEKPKTALPSSIVISGLKTGGRTISIHMAKGEILLLSGEAAPIDSLWDQFFLLTQNRPEYTISGLSLPYHSMAGLIKHRIAMISSKLPQGGLMHNLTAEDNILMPSYKKISSHLGFYKKASSYILKDNFLFEDGEFPVDIDETVNEWKLVFYRWKLFNPKLLIVHNVITAAGSWERDWMKRRLLEMAERGTAILLLEHDTAFCLGFSDKSRTEEE